MAFVFFRFARTQNVRALGFFELQILEIENYRGQLATGECCGGGTSTTVQQHYNKFNASSLHCAGAPQCNTLFRVCLREYQSRQPSSTSMVSSSRMSDDDTTGMGSNHQQLSSTLHHCSFGNVTSPVLGANSFTLGGDTLQAATDSSSDSVNRGAAGGNLALPFSFSWTVSIYNIQYIIILRIYRTLATGTRYILLFTNQNVS